MADSRTLPLSRSDLLQLSKTCVQFVDARIMSSRSYSATLIRRISPLPPLDQDEDENIFRQISTPSPLPRNEPSSEQRRAVSPSSLSRRPMSPDRLERMDIHNRLTFQSRSTAPASESQRSLSLQAPSLSRASCNSATESPSESVKYHARIDSLLDSPDAEPTFTVEPYSQAENSHPIAITAEIKGSSSLLNNSSHIHPRTSSLHHHLRLHIGLVSVNASKRKQPSKPALFKRKPAASNATSWLQRVLVSMDGLLLLFPVPSGAAVPTLLKRHGLVPVPLALMNTSRSHLNQLEAELVDFCTRVLAERAAAVLDIMDICGMEVDDSCDFILRIATSGHKGNFRSGGMQQRQQQGKEDMAMQMDAAQLKFNDAVSRTHWKMIIQQMQERC
ncbi:hypothetical protein HDU78_011344 [Chytriomyces hyalinus]|nr:hypothetical protein HDU78_011344 [Chytriomyces hyalinus]